MWTKIYYINKEAKLERLKFVSLIWLVRLAIVRKTSLMKQIEVKKVPCQSDIKRSFMEFRNLPSFTSDSVLL